MLKMHTNSTLSSSEHVAPQRLCGGLLPVEGDPIRLGG